MHRDDHPFAVLGFLGGLLAPIDVGMVGHVLLAFGLAVASGIGGAIGRAVVARYLSQGEKP